jgi:uncharacterized membrane protein YoaK (UPF0700 family)
MLIEDIHTVATVVLYFDGLLRKTINHIVSIANFGTIAIIGGLQKQFFKLTNMLTAVFPWQHQ